MQTKTYPPTTLNSLSQLEGIDEYTGNPKEIIYIVAGNRKEFENYANDKLRDQANKYKEYRYINNRYDLMGLNDIKGYYIGTALQREDIVQIKQAIAYVKERADPIFSITYSSSKVCYIPWEITTI